MNALELIEYLRAESGAEVLVNGKPIVAVDMQYGKPINLVSKFWRPRLRRRRGKA